MPRALEVERVGKRYRLGEGFERYQTIRESLTSSFRRVSGSSDGPERELWALKDVSLAVGLVLMVTGAVYFQKVERRLGDRI